MAAKIRKGDKVIVLNGRDKGRTGTVLQVMPKDGKVLVAKGYGVRQIGRIERVDEGKPQLHDEKTARRRPEHGADLEDAAIPGDSVGKLFQRHQGREK